MKSWTLNCFHFIMAYIRGLEVCNKKKLKKPRQLSATYSIYHCERNYIFITAIAKCV